MALPIPLEKLQQLAAQSSGHVTDSDNDHDESLEKKTEDKENVLETGIENGKVNDEAENGENVFLDDSETASLMEHFPGNRHRSRQTNDSNGMCGSICGDARNVVGNADDAHRYLAESNRNYINRNSNGSLTGASTARDLVQSQERLLEMLQTMKADISSMDREASRIKEDVVRSNQLFDIVVHMKEAHHLPFSRDGFNISHSMPRITYSKQPSYFDRPMSMRYLNQLSTFRKGNHSNASSRRSSVSSEYANACQVRAKHRRSIRESLDILSRDEFRRTSRVESPNDVSDNYSGTESDIESTTGASDTGIHRIGRYRPIIRSRGWSEATGSSTESSATVDPEDELPVRNVNRRSSYFYTTRIPTPPETQSDDVEL